MKNIEVENMSITLNQILSLVGKLDDTPVDSAPRERFRRFLKENVKEIGQIRDYVDECLRNKGEQYNKALQDLVNYLGEFLGFEVVFGRYQGAPGKIGNDGLWKSPKGFYIVIEVKTTEVYAIKTSTLVGYVDQLISDKKIPDWDCAMGLYVVGRPDPEVNQFENSIIAEKRTDQLRIVSVNSLLDLGEIMNEYEVDHEDILAVIQPSRPTIDPIAGLIARLVAQPKPEKIEEEEAILEEEKKEKIEYWLTPVKGDDEATAEECIKNLVGEKKIYAFGDRTPGRRHLNPGDMICFYAAGKGVVAHARVASRPEKKKHNFTRNPEKYPWLFHLKNEKLYLDTPVIIDTTMRTKLEAFEGIDPNRAWGWFVTSTRKLSEKDFEKLTRTEKGD
jgi:hypothetical protein